MKISLIGALALSLLATSALSAAEAPAKVKIDSGVLAGVADSGVVTFRGIPFAAPPVGALRWAPPQHPAAWTGERDASKVGSACLQKAARGWRGRCGNSWSARKTRLYLNVFAPQTAKKAPVMVWIHGGSNVSGSGANYDGTQFAKDGVVVVTINYRMGAMGFFAHPALTKEAKADQPLANFAMMDQMESLRWVQRNIAALWRY